MCNRAGGGLLDDSLLQFNSRTSKTTEAACLHIPRPDTCVHSPTSMVRHVPLQLVGGKGWGAGECCGNLCP